MWLHRCRSAIVVAGITCTTAATSVGSPPTTYWVEADDGVLLATDVYIPDGDGPWPVVLERTLHGKTRSDLVQACESFRAGGLACAVQDQRGFGDSGGEYVSGRTEGDDGRTTVTWLAEQSWCDGRVGPAGESAMGEAQYRLAPAAPAALVDISARITTADPYHHQIFVGGALRKDLIDAVTAALGLPPWTGSRLYDEDWDPIQPLNRVDEIQVPGLHIGGWFDAYPQGILDAFSTIQSNGGPGAAGHQKLIMGPWTHFKVGNSIYLGELKYPPDVLMDIEAVDLAWQQHWLLGADNGVADWPTALVYVMGATPSLHHSIPPEPNAPGNVWVELDGWPPPAIPLELYLGADGGLSRLSAVADQLELRIDPEDPVPTRGGGNLLVPSGSRDQSSIEARDDVLVFSSAELSHPLTVMGPVSVSLWVVPDTTDLDLAVRLSDVYPSGHSMLVTDGIQRARMRCSDEFECFLTRGVPVEIEVDLWSTAMIFNRGHRLRISVSGSNSPRFEVNPNHGGDLDGNEPGEVAQPRVLFGPDYPSRLVLPVPITEPRGGGRRVSTPSP